MVTLEKAHTYDTTDQKALALGLALSGGGFRATLFHLGVLKCLSDAGLLGRVSHVTSVSGGSILAAHLFEHWDGYLADFAKTARPLLEFVQYDIRGRILRRLPYSYIRRRWRRTELLRDYYHELFLPKLSEVAAKVPLDTASPPRPHLAILATNLNSGSMYAFSEQYVYVVSRDEVKALRTDLPLTSLKVAISSAFPGFFPPITLTHRDVALDVAEFQESQCFTDGGVFDNLGIRFYKRAFELNALSQGETTKGSSDYFWKDVPDVVMASNASSAFDVRTGTRTLFSTALRAVDILMNRLGIMDVESIIGEPSDANKFRYLALDTMIDTEEDRHCLNVALQRAVRFIRTDLDAFSKLECRCLVQHGYCVARRELKRMQSSMAVPEGEASEQLAAGLAKVHDETPWDPFDGQESSPLEEPLRGDAVTEGATEVAGQQCRLLHKGARTRLKFFSRSDPIPTLLNVAILLTILAVIGVVSWRAVSDAPGHWRKDPVIDNIVETRTLRVGFLDQSDADLGFLLYKRPSSSSPEGFDVKIVEHILKELPERFGAYGEFSFHPRPKNWEELLDMPRKNEADIVISSISFTVEREKRHGLRFSVPYHETNMCIVGHPFEIKDLEMKELKGETADKTVLVVAKTTAATVAEWLKPQLGWNIREVESFEELCELFEREDDSFAVTDSPLANSLEKRGCGYVRELKSQEYPDAVAPERRKEYYAIGMPKKSALLTWAINSIIMEMARDGTLRELRVEAQLAYELYQLEKFAADVGHGQSPFAERWQ